jgi:GNAT superfamily N-acetyltransferase
MRVHPATQKDLEVCCALDHSYTTDHVWQMEAREENGAVVVHFRVANLPREMRVEYPLQGEQLLEAWQQRDGFLVAEDGGSIRGYVSLTAGIEHHIAWANDLVVDQGWRRRGIGTMLLHAAVQWGREQGMGRLAVAVQTKNYPAIRFCRSRGMSFCGYNDQYWPTRDIALFFGELLR